MESWRQILIAYPLLQDIWNAAIIIIPLATLIAYSGMFFLVSTAKIISVSRKRQAYNKCAMQLAVLGVILGWALLIGSRVWLYYTQHEDITSGIVPFLKEISWIMLSIGVLLGSIFLSLRNVLKNMPVLHVTIGMISAAQNCIALIIVIFTIRATSATLTPEAANLALPELFPSSWDDPLWSAFCYTLPLVLAMPGAIAACWLVIRRKKDDYGRDYYNTMVPWCAAWARNGWLFLWLLLCASTGIQIGIDMRSGVFNAQDAMIDNARILLWLVPVLLWAIVKKSAIPLRHSWLLFVAFILAGLFMMPYYLQFAII